MPERSTPAAPPPNVRFKLETGVEPNALFLIGGGVTLLALFTLARGLGDPPDSFGRSANVVTAIALGALVPFILAVYVAARDGLLELTADAMLVRVGFLLNARVLYQEIQAVGEPVKRPKSTYGLSVSYRRHELSAGRLSEAVEVTLARRRRMGTRLLFPFLTVSSVWLGVDDSRALIKELRARVRTVG
ncbi:MAG: hypothetical protein FJ029_02705 [Actinobacteria bacterium]|nr:hypothetical protein [Actinomycetota bacterium]